MNQLDHGHLDRKRVVEILRDLARAAVAPAAPAVPSGTRLGQLVAASRTDVARDWLRVLSERRLRLPSAANRAVAETGAISDFVYEVERAAVYVDGDGDPERDREHHSALEDAGWTVLRFGRRESWEATLSRWPTLFGVTTSGGRIR